MSFLPFMPLSSYSVASALHHLSKKASSEAFSFTPFIFKFSVFGFPVSFFSVPCFRVNLPTILFADYVARSKIRFHRSD